jgi:hypothetical protein
MDASFLVSVGLGGSLPSAQLRLFGGAPGMLPEANARPRVDDLEELPLQVVEGGDGTISGTDYVLFYATGPNLFTRSTAFWFEHTKPGMDLQVQIQILTITGRIIKTISRTINTDGNRSNDTIWNDKDNFSNRVGRGVYLYCLNVQSVDGKEATKLQRLVSLR